MLKYANDSDDGTNNNESDLEEFHTKQQLIEQQLEKLELANKQNRGKISGPKQRTISTLSDYNFNPSGASPHPISGSNAGESNLSVYYRLASVGQDNQICFWDLTEDILKERPILAHQRSRLTSVLSNTVQNPALLLHQQQQQIQLPQITLQQMHSSNSIATVAKTDLATAGNYPLKSNHHHSTTSSLVSTARNLFSKHTDKSVSVNQKLEQQTTDGEETNNHPTAIKTLGSGMWIFLFVHVVDLARLEIF